MAQQISSFESGDLNLRFVLDGDYNHDDEKLTSFVVKCMEGIVEAIRVSRIVNDPSFVAKKEAHVNHLLSLFPPHRFNYYREVPNEYWTDHYGLDRPWLLVHTDIGIIKIGYRKRVVSIDWGETCLAAESSNAATLFPDVVLDGDDPYNVHAWSPEDAREFLERLLNSERKQ